MEFTHCLWPSIFVSPWGHQGMNNGTYACYCVRLIERQTCMYTTTLTHAHTNALRAHTCTVCMHLRIQFIVDKTTCKYLHSPSPNWLWRMSVTWQQHGTLMCVHCGQLSEVTRPHPCVGCGGIISNALEAFLYYENSICLSCYTGAEALHIQNEVSCTSNEAVCLCLSATTIITSIDSCAICVYISNTLHSQTCMYRHVCQLGLSSASHTILQGAWLFAILVDMATTIATLATTQLTDVHNAM